MKRFAIFLAALSLACAAGRAAAQDAAKADSRPRVRLETTLGVIVLELDREKAPLTVQNFLRYVSEGYYDGLIFHRVIPTFMIQGGGYDKDMNEKRRGLHPPIPLESRNGLKNARGAIAMARTADPDSATSQFFINVVDNPFLDHPRPDGHGYAVFGRVAEGMDIVDVIRRTRLIRHPRYPSPEPATPEVPVVIQKAALLGREGR
ncbi:MAG: peptidylprolyl isomerase [Candidatus Tectomicrobia bacterium]|nr:peptidylprolyl isomerase [Candidatus Tectomicrobia bacterium]